MNWSRSVLAKYLLFVPLIHALPFLTVLPAQGGRHACVVLVGSRAFSSISLLFLEALAEHQKAEGEWGDSTHCLFSSGLVTMGWLCLFIIGQVLPEGPLRTATLSSLQSLLPPLAPSHLLLFAAPHSSQPWGTSLYRVPLKLVHAFVNPPFIQPPQMTLCKCAIWVSSQFLSGIGILTTFTSPPVFAPLIFHYYFLQPEIIWFFS